MAVCGTHMLSPQQCVLFVLARNAMIQKRKAMKAVIKIIMVIRNFHIDLLY